MNFVHEANQIVLYNDEKQMIAEVTFPRIDDNTVNINHTFVDDSLRGQGVASKLMEAAAIHIRKDGKKAVLTCSYAINWFKKHEEFKDIVA